MTSVTMAPARLHSALSILDKEEARIPLTGARQNLYNILLVVAYGFPAVATIVGVLWGLGAVISVWPWEVGLARLWTIVFVYIWVTAAVAPASLVMITLMLFLNAKLLVRILRQDILLRRLGLTGWLAVTSNADATTSIWDKLSFALGPFIAGCGVTFLVAALLLPLPVPAAFPDYAWDFPLVEPPSLETRAAVMLPIVFCLLWTLFACALYLAIHALRLGKARLNHIAALRAGLERTGEAGQIDAKLYGKLAGVERAQIVRSRADSIRAFEAERGAALLVQKSTKAMTALRQLDGPTSLLVMEAIEGLASGSAQSNGSEPALMPVEGTDIEIVYVMIPDRQRLRILDLHAAEPAVVRKQA